MAERQIEFAYHNIELTKSESLGSGSYGAVCKAKCDGLLCAAKIMHPTLFDLRDPGAESYLRKFQEECHLLSLARHPNVVQYLTTYSDPDTRLPVLLMELCDESLTAFLERSPGPLSYHIQLNISHDITLALVYLHSNGLIHRDLTGNNILMIAGTRAKITDFGMSKLATGNLRMTALTLCPGNELYMSPEALDEAKSYTAKLDIFSFGVIVIQILTRLFPKPTHRFREVFVPGHEEPLRKTVHEVQRRQAHLELISETHPLKQLALQCLKNKENERPLALQLSERLAQLKLSYQYRESLRTHTSNDIQQLKQQLQSQRTLIDTKTREVQEHQALISELQDMVEEQQHMIQTKDQELQNNQCIIQEYTRQLDENQATIRAKDRQLLDNQHKITSRDEAVAVKERELKQTQDQLRARQLLVSEFQISLSQKDKTISVLQQTISDYKRKIQELEQQDTISKYQPQHNLIMTPQMIKTQKNINSMIWRDGKSVPEKMTRGAAIVHGNTAYFKPSRSKRVYSYQIILGKEQWFQLPDNLSEDCGLTVIDGLITSVGGYNNGYINTLLSLTTVTGEGERKQWLEIFPPMPTKRKYAACITTQYALVVAGGLNGKYL